MYDAHINGENLPIIHDANSYNARCYDAVLTNITSNYNVNIINNAVSKQCRVCTPIIHSYTW